MVSPTDTRRKVDGTVCGEGGRWLYMGGGGGGGYIWRVVVTYSMRGGGVVVHVGRYMVGT